MSLALLNWYDQHKRDFPWRRAANPYHIWLCEVMSQQTTMAAVVPYYERFIEAFPTVHDLAAARQEDVMALWAGLGYYSRARNIHKAARIISESGYPENLESLPGIGRYTAAAINTMAFNRPDIVVDGNVERILARLFAVETPLPAAKKELYAIAATLYAYHLGRAGALAQSLMDLGALICKPKNPKCNECPLREWCQAQSDAYPKRMPKAEKPKRTATAYWIENEVGEVLFERRPAKGLLGGTVGLPCTDLKSGQGPIAIVLNASSWRRPGSTKNKALDKKDVDAGLRQHDEQKVIKHIFTHFELTLTVKRADVTSYDGARYFWARPEQVEGMSSLFRKTLYEEEN